MPPPKPLGAPTIDTAPFTDGVRALARRGALHRYRKGTLLIQEGDHGDVLYLIVSGRLRAFSTHPANDREVTYGVYGPGEYVGEMGLDGGPRSANVIVLEACTCAVVTRRTLEAHIAEHPAFAFELLAKVIRRARAATLSTRELALNDAYGRLKALLESLAVARPDGALALAEHLTHRDLASRMGCTREMVTRLLADLQRGGYVRPEDTGMVLVKGLPTKW